MYCMGLGLSHKICTVQQIIITLISGAECLQNVVNIRNNDNLKGQCHEIFYLRFFASDYPTLRNPHV
jgi:hypothetical protein